MINTVFLKNKYNFIKEHDENKNDIIIGFIGSKNKHDQIRTPTIEQPVFIALDIDYALQYTSGRTANEAEEETPSGFIQVLKIPKEYLKCLDLSNNSEEAAKQLKFPDIMKFIFFSQSGMQWTTGQLLHSLLHSLDQFVFKEALAAGKNFNNKRKLASTNDFLKWDVQIYNPTLINKYFPKKTFTSNQLYDFIKWVSEHPYLKESLEEYFTTARAKTYKDSYKIVEQLFFKPIHDLGYNSFLNIEAKSKCIGFMDADLIQNCTSKSYTAQDAINKYKNNKYSKQQLLEAIAYWSKQLKQLDETLDVSP